MLERTLLGVAVAALLLPVAATARVSDADIMVTGEARGEVRSVTVALGDLDLRTDRSVRTAQTRIRHAAQQVCDINTTRALYQKRDYSRCYVPTITTARADLDTLVNAVRAG